MWNLIDFLKRLFSTGSNLAILSDIDPNDITTYPINEIKNSGRFTTEHRRLEYRRRSKSPSGVIDGEYNDEYRGNDEGAGVIF